MREWFETSPDEPSEDPPDPGIPVVVITVVISKSWVDVDCQVLVRGGQLRGEGRRTNFDLGCEGINESGDETHLGCAELRNIRRTLVGVRNVNLQSK